METEHTRVSQEKLIEDTAPITELRSTVENVTKGSIDESKLRFCKQCENWKRPHEYYFKSKGRIDTVCTSCRKVERKDRYHGTSDALARPTCDLNLPQIEAEANDRGVSEGRNPEVQPVLSDVEFRELTEVFQILANIRDRSVKRKVA